MSVADVMSLPGANSCSGAMSEAGAMSVLRAISRTCSALDAHPLHKVDPFARSATVSAFPQLLHFGIRRLLSPLKTGR
jgi:hypothetical protein